MKTRTVSIKANLNQSDNMKTRTVIIKDNIKSSKAAIELAENAREIFIKSKNKKVTVFMEPKQLATTWLIKEINKKIDLKTLKYWNEIEEIVNKANKIEKSIIAIAFDSGKGSSITGEEYANIKYHKP